VPTKKKRFEWKKKDVDYIKGVYKDKKNHNTLSPSSQIAKKKPEAQSNQINN